jgi:hypothetical protein
MIGVTAFNIVVNMAVMGHASYKRLKLQFIKLKIKYKTWKMKRAKKEDIN